MHLVMIVELCESRELTLVRNKSELEQFSWKFPLLRKDHCPQKFRKKELLRKSANKPYIKHQERAKQTSRQKVQTKAKGVLSAVEE